MIDSIHVFDNLLPKNYQDLIENALLGEKNCNWLLLDDISYGGENRLENANPGLVHPLKVDNQVISPLFNLFLPLVLVALEKINCQYNNTIMARSFLQFPQAISTANNIHVDLEIPHTVCLYYVNDSDGPTRLYKQGTTEVIRQVDPKKGRILIFDGKYYHSSSNPTVNKRCIINFDIV